MTTTAASEQKTVVVLGREMTVEPSDDPRFVAILVGSRGARYGCWRPTTYELPEGLYFVFNVRTERHMMDGWQALVVEL